MEEFHGSPCELIRFSQPILEPSNHLVSNCGRIYHREGDAWWRERRRNTCNQSIFSEMGLPVECARVGPAPGHGWSSVGDAGPTMPRSCVWTRSGAITPAVFASGVMQCPSESYIRLELLQLPINPRWTIGSSPQRRIALSARIIRKRDPSNMIVF